MSEIKFTVGADDSAVTKMWQRIKEGSKNTVSQVEKDFQKVAAKQKQLQMEVSYGDKTNANTGSTVNPQNAARAVAANAAYAGSATNARIAVTEQAAATVKATVAQQAQSVSIQQLTIKLAAYQAIAAKATNPNILKQYNQKIQETQAEISRLSNIGKTGFDALGNAVQKNRVGLAGMWDGLKNVANLIPGIGLAGLAAFAIEPIMKYISSLGIFQKSINTVLESRKQLNEATLKGNQNAQAELTNLRINYKAITDANIPLVRRKEIYAQMQKDYPAYFANLSFEEAQAGRTTGAYNNLTTSILSLARAQAYKDKITENANLRLTEEEKVIDLKAKQAAYLESARKQEVAAQSALDSQLRSQFTANAKLNRQYAKETEREIKVIEANIKVIDNRNKSLEQRSLNEETTAKPPPPPPPPSPSKKGTSSGVITKNTVDEEKKLLDRLLDEYQTYQDKRNEIIMKAIKDASVLQEAGFNMQADMARGRGQKSLDELDEEHFKSLESYRSLFENLETASKDYTLQAISNLEAELQVFEGSTEVKKRLSKELSDLRDKLNAPEEEKPAEIIPPKAKADLHEILQSIRGIASEFDNINGSIGSVVTGLLTAGKAYLELKESLKTMKNKDATPTEKGIAGVGMVGAALAVVNTIFGYFKGLKKAKEEAKKALSEFQATATKGEQEYQSLLRKRDLDQVARGKNTYKAIVAQLDLLKSQSPKIQAAFDKVYASLQGQSSVSSLGSKNGTLLRKAKTWDIMASLAGADYKKLEQLYSQGKLKDTAKSDFEALRALKEELEAAGLQVEELQSQLKELLTGTSTSGLASSLSELFENGKFAAKDFGKSFEQIMSTAIKNSFRLKVMEDALTPFYNEFANLFINGTPTEAQIDDLKAKYEALGIRLGDQFKELEKITGRSLTDKSGSGSSLRGIADQITETTGTAIVGAFNGMRIVQLQHLKVSEGAHLTNQQCLAIATQTLTVAMRIEQNTFRTADHTGQALPFLKNISDNTKDTLSVQLRAGGKFGY